MEKRAVRRRWIGRGMLGVLILTVTILISICVYEDRVGSMDEIMSAWEEYEEDFRATVPVIQSINLDKQHGCYNIYYWEEYAHPRIRYVYDDDDRREWFDFKEDDGSVAILIKEEAARIISVKVMENGSDIICYQIDIHGVFKPYDGGIYYSPNDEPLMEEGIGFYITDKTADEVEQSLDAMSTLVVKEDGSGFVFKRGNSSYTTGRLCENWFFYEDRY